MSVTDPSRMRRHYIFSKTFKLDLLSVLPLDLLYFIPRYRFKVSFTMIKGAHGKAVCIDVFYSIFILIRRAYETIQSNIKDGGCGCVSFLLVSIQISGMGRLTR